MPIVVAVDFSPASRKAVDAAALLADDLEQTLVLVHAFAPRLGGMAAEGHPDPITKVQLEIDMDEATTLSTEWAGALRKKGLDVDTVARAGKVHEVVADEVKSRKAGLVVVGSHGRSGLRRAVLGSVAESILRSSAVPVVVVPSK